MLTFYLAMTYLGLFRQILSVNCQVVKGIPDSNCTMKYNTTAITCSILILFYLNGKLTTKDKELRSQWIWFDLVNNLQGRYSSLGSGSGLLRDFLCLLVYPAAKWSNHAELFVKGIIVTTWLCTFYFLSLVSMLF